MNYNINPFYDYDLHEKKEMFLLHSDINLNFKIHEIRYSLFGFRLLKLSQLKR